MESMRSIICENGDAQKSVESERKEEGELDEVFI